MSGANTRSLRSPSLFAFVALVSAVCLIILGLLGMKLFKAEPASHAPAAATTAISAGSNQANLANQTPASVELLTAVHHDGVAVNAAPQVATGTAGHIDMVTACILALLLSLALVFAPSFRTLRRHLFSRLIALSTPAVTRGSHQTPILLLHSISRT